MPLFTHHTTIFITTSRTNRVFVTRSNILMLSQCDTRFARNYLSPFFRFSLSRRKLVSAEVPCSTRPRETLGTRLGKTWEKKGRFAQKKHCPISKRITCAFYLLQVSKLSCNCRGYLGTSKLVTGVFFIRQYL